MKSKAEILKLKSILPVTMNEIKNVTETENTR